MNLDDVSDALVERLNTILGLRAFSEIPQSINPPAAIVGLGSGNTVTVDSRITVLFGVYVLLSASNNKGSQRELRSYCVGDKSVPDAIETFDLTLAGVSTGCSVDSNGWKAPEVVTLGGTDYIGIEFEFEVAE